jgi:hypothetical protein
MSTDRRGTRGCAFPVNFAKGVEMKGTMMKLAIVVLVVALALVAATGVAQASQTKTFVSGTKSLTVTWIYTISGTKITTTGYHLTLKGPASETITVRLNEGTTTKWQKTGVVSAGSMVNWPVSPAKTTVRATTRTKISAFGTTFTMTP